MSAYRTLLCSEEEAPVEKGAGGGCTGGPRDINIRPRGQALACWPMSYRSIWCDVPFESQASSVWYESPDHFMGSSALFQKPGLAPAMFLPLSQPQNDSDITMGDLAMSIYHTFQTESLFLHSLQLAGRSGTLILNLILLDASVLILLS